MLALDCVESFNGFLVDDRIKMTYVLLDLVIWCFILSIGFCRLVLVANVAKIGECRCLDFLLV